MSLYFVTLSFLCGCVLFYVAEHNIGIVFIGLCGVCILTVLLYKHYASKKLVVVCALVLLVGAGRAYMHNALLPEIDSALLGRYATYEGTIIAEPDVREKVTHYVVRLHNEDVFVRATRNHYPELAYGETVVLRGVLELPENFTNEAGGTFDYIHFLEKQRIQYVMAFPAVVTHTPLSGFSLYTYVLQFKYWFVAELNKKIPPQHAALAGGILLGTKQSLGKELLEAFQRVGLIHIVVLSGYNVTLIAEAIQKLLRIFPRTIAFGGSIFSIICFAIMTGASATTIRASMMALIVVVAGYMYRNYQVHRALWFAGLLMMIHNPMIVLYDPGFQLSFIATLGLLHISPFIELLLEKLHIPNVLELRTILSATIATQIAVAPLLIMMTGSLSIISLLANILVLPSIPLGMLVSAIVALLPFDFLYVPFGYFAYGVLEYVFIITKELAKLPFAVMTF